MAHGSMQFLFRGSSEDRFGVLRVRRAHPHRKASMAFAVAGLGETHGAIKKP